MPRRNPRPDPGRRGRRAPTWGPDPVRAAERERRRREVCAGKARYATEAEARAHALMHQPGPGPRPNAYRCDVCDGWHFTSRR
ncbi:MAG: hypothetical protein M0P31_08890 [Solirubrobacteraceae bacterium]|nr:hypothetical protein [Solirubrobacteraceae bacterium]